MKEFVFALMFAVAAPSCQKKDSGNPADLVNPLPATGQVAAAAADAGEPGYSTRDFTLPDVKGGKFTLSSLKGNYVFLDFWASWCGPCVEAIPTLNILQDRYGSRGFTVLGVSVDDETLETIGKFVQTNGIKYRVVLGSDDLINRFGKSRGLPTAFLLDREGRVVQKFVGEYPSERLISEVAAVVAPEPVVHKEPPPENAPAIQPDPKK